MKSMTTAILGLIVLTMGTGHAFADEKVYPVGSVGEFSKENAGKSCAGGMLPGAIVGMIASVGTKSGGAIAAKLAAALTGGCVLGVAAYSGAAAVAESRASKTPRSQVAVSEQGTGYGVVAEKKTGDIAQQFE